MNLIDIAVLALFAYFFLSGLYRGFVSTALSIGAYVLSCALAFLCMPIASNWIKSNQNVYNMALFYTEGANYVGDATLSHTNITQLSAVDLSSVMDNADLPVPMAARISENVAKEAFSSTGISTLGEYFNQTIVNVFINIFSLLMFFVIIRVILLFFIHLVDYAQMGFPALAAVDNFIGAGLGLVRGFLAMYIVFLVTPAILIVLPSAKEYVTNSFFGSFFYTSNFLLRLIPG